MHLYTWVPTVICTQHMLQKWSLLLFTGRNFLAIVVSLLDMTEIHTSYIANYLKTLKSELACYLCSIQQICNIDINHIFSKQGILKQKNAPSFLVKIIISLPKFVSLEWRKDKFFVQKNHQHQQQFLGITQNHCEF